MSHSQLPVQRVCFLLYNLDPGGLETYLLRFLKIHHDHFEATVITKSGRTGLLLNEYLGIKIDIIPLKTGYFNFSGWIKIYKLFRTKQWDSVCDLTSNFSGIYLFLAWLARIKIRVAYYGQSDNHFKLTSFNLFYNRLINRLVRIFATGVVSNSEAALNFFFNKYWLTDSRFRIIYNGVDASYFSRFKNQILKQELGIPLSAKIVVHTGRLDDKKNHRTILRVAKLLKDKYTDIYFIMCGKDTEKLLPVIHDEGLEGFVFALGYRSDVPMILQNADIFYFPSISEGMPNSLIEAMLCGLPIVASNLDSIKETLPDNYWSQLVDPNDAESAGLKIIEILDGSNTLDFSQLRIWAIEQFDATKRFDEFKSSILSLPAA